MDHECGGSSDGNTQNQPTRSRLGLANQPQDSRDSDRKVFLVQSKVISTVIWGSFSGGFLGFLCTMKSPEVQPFYDLRAL